MFLYITYNYIKTFNSIISDINPLSTGYSDVGTNNFESMDAIQAVSAHGLMRGYPDKTFGPDKVMTRAETAQVLALFLIKTESIAKFYDRAPYAS